MMQTNTPEPNMSQKELNVQYVTMLISVETHR